MTVANIVELLEEICLIGSESGMPPQISQIESFQHFRSPDGSLDTSDLDKRDGSCTRRELLLRFLVLNAVLDQGPDIVGVRTLLTRVTNDLYRREVRFLHSPLAFFKEIGMAIDKIVEKHASIKELRAEILAKQNQANPTKYNLFMDNSKQALNYAVFRRGVPLALPLLLERDEEDDDAKHDVLCRYLSGWRSAEEMSSQLKSHERYGLGKAIGDKACHLVAKWAVSTLGLLRTDEPNWGPLSFEVPFDSNAGRVLWRTGFFLRWADESDYMKKEVVQHGRGKSGLNYIRVTNIRGMKATREMPEDVRSAYVEICCKHLCTHRSAPRLAEIQRIPHAYLLARDLDFGAAELDDGLIHIGTHYCLNHENPRCDDCPLNELCEARQCRPELILEYRT